MERTKLQKAILIILLAMAVVFAVVTGVLRAAKGVSFEGGLLAVSREENRTVYSGRAEGENITLTVEPCATGYAVDFSAGTQVILAYRVEYPGGTIRGKFGDYERLCITLHGKTVFEGGYNPNISGARFCDLQGEAVLSHSVHWETGGRFWQHYQLNPYQIMEFIDGPELTSRGSWAAYAFATFCTLIVAVDVAFPELLFYLRYGMSVRNPEPSEMYLSMQKVCWVILPLVLLGFYLWGATRVI